MDPAQHPSWDTARPLMRLPSLPGRRLVRLVRLVLLAALALAVFGWIAAHDPGPGLKLTVRGWVTVAAAAVAVLAIAKHRGNGRRWLFRMLGEYAVIALLAVSLAAASHPQPAHPPAARAKAAAATAAIGPGCPAIAKTRAWVECVLKQASAEADRQAQGQSHR